MISRKPVSDAIMVGFIFNKNRDNEIKRAEEITKYTGAFINSALHNHFDTTLHIFTIPSKLDNQN